MTRRLSKEKLMTLAERISIWNIAPSDEKDFSFKGTIYSGEIKEGNRTIRVLVGKDSNPPPIMYGLYAIDPNTRAILGRYVTVWDPRVTELYDKIRKEVQPKQK